jgi:hypothetical protein
MREEEVGMSEVHVVPALYFHQVEVFPPSQDFQNFLQDVNYIFQTFFC